MSTLNNIIITACNSPYFESLLTLISTCHKHSMNTVDKIFVYNLGLDTQEIKRLESIKNVTVVNFSEEAKNSHPKFMEPKSYVYKTYCLYNSRQYGNNVLWVDSGAAFLKSSKIIFEKIKQDHIFLVADSHKNIDYTHTECRQKMNASESELNDRQLWAGLIGYKSGGKFQIMIDEAYKYAMIPGCLDGNQENHRHDQSIMSILASRYAAPTQDIDIYGYWTDANRNLEKALEMGSVVFAHRRGYSNSGDIVYV